MEVGERFTLKTRKTSQKDLKGKEVHLHVQHFEEGISNMLPSENIILIQITLFASTCESLVQLKVS